MVKKSYRQNRLGGAAMKISKILFLVMVCASMLVMLSCSSDSDKVYNYEASLGDFQLELAADTIGSYPGGGGVFIIRLDPDSIFNNTVLISVTADTALHSELTDTTISNSYPITELAIAPGTIDIDTFQIVLTGTCDTLVRTETLTVVMYADPGPVPQEFLDARDAIITWVVANYPEHGSLGGQNFSAYKATLGIIYGGTSWAFLSDTWQLRVSRPVVPDPPYTMYLRYRGEWDYCLTVHKNADGLIEVL
jgi:hypothetical protein